MHALAVQSSVPALGGRGLLTGALRPSALARTLTGSALCTSSRCVHAEAQTSNASIQAAVRQLQLGLPSLASALQSMVGEVPLWTGALRQPTM